MKSIVETSYDNGLLPESHDRNELKTMVNIGDEDFEADKEDDFVIGDDFDEDILLID